MNKKNEFPIELTSLKRWVGVRENSKVPLRCIPIDGPNGEVASSTDINTWMTYEDAKVGLTLGFIDMLGFVFYEQDGFVGIDIDSGKDEDGFVSPLACELIKLCQSYTEESRSGRGYHIIMKGKLPFLGKNNKKGLEIYSGARYFIMTSKQCFYSEIIENQEAIDIILDKYFKEELRTSNNLAGGTNFYNPTYEKPQKGKLNLKPIYPKIQQGTRNLSLLSLAGQLYQTGLDKRTIYKELLKCNNEACIPPLERSEVETIVNSIFKYERK